MGRRCAVSIHAPRAGRDFHLGRPASYAFRFQSTRPVRGATSQASMRGLEAGRFNPRAPCGARHRNRGCLLVAHPFQSTRPVRGATTIRFVPGSRYTVSIHAPRAGRDSDALTPSAIAIAFQSTRPVRGATWRGKQCQPGRSGFNPRAPCGARPAPPRGGNSPDGFNPRAPCGARQLLPEIPTLQ